jgi:hypothetical protein
MTASGGQQRRLGGGFCWFFLLGFFYFFLFFFLEFVAYDLPVPDLSKSELGGRQPEDWNSKTEGTFRLCRLMSSDATTLSGFFLGFAVGYLHLATSMVMSSCCS